jgi:hypothetical protein
MAAQLAAIGGRVSGARGACPEVAAEDRYLRIMSHERYEE